MNIHGHQILQVLRTGIACPYTCPCQEEALLWSKFILHTQLLCLHHILKCTESDVQTTIVTDVLTQSHLAVYLLASQLNLVEMVNQDLGARLEVLLVSSSPPVVLVTGLVKLAALIVKAMTHLMTDYSTDTTIVHRIIGCWVEEWRLENSCREADLVGSWVIISIDSLRSHSPLSLIYRLVHLAGDFILGKELRDICHILVERKAVIYLQSAIVLPLVRITYLDDEVLQLILSLCLGSSTHPCSLVDAL